MFNRFMDRLRRVPPLILILLVVLLIESFMNSQMSIWEWLYSKILMIPAIVLGVSFHEAAHAYSSYKLGDPTPKYQGRLTLNPLAHFDVAGLIALMFIGFGWGKPVEINPDYYKNRRTGEIIVGFAGVVANLLIAVVFSFILRAYMQTGFSTSTLGDIIYEMILYIVYINLILMMFNLIPIPPLDGFGILTQIFKLDKYSWWYTYYHYGYYILLFVICLGLPSRIISPGVYFFLNLLLG